MSKRTHKTQNTSKNQQSSNLNLVVIVAVVALLLAGGIIFVLAGGSGDGSSNTNSVGEVTEENGILILNSQNRNQNAENVNDAQAMLTLEDISPNEYVSTFNEGEVTHVLLDVREEYEFADGHIEGASRISVANLQNNLDVLPRDVPIVVYCRSGNRSSQAAQILASNGFTEIYDLGGINDWQAAGQAIVR